MRKSIFAATITMLVGAASANGGAEIVIAPTPVVESTVISAPAVTETTVVAPIVTETAGATSLVDVPANHWANEAIKTSVAAGLIQGFPDGTFRGNRNLTRYEMAVILDRLLKSGQLGSGNLSEEQLVVITKGIQDLSSEIAAINTRLGDVERIGTEHSARISALESSISSLDVSNTTVLVERIGQLEERVRMLEEMHKAGHVHDMEQGHTHTTTEVVKDVTDTKEVVMTDVVTPAVTAATTAMVTEVVRRKVQPEMYIGLGGAVNLTNKSFSDRANDKLVNGTISKGNGVVTSQNKKYNIGNPLCDDPIESLKNTFNKKAAAVPGIDGKQVNYCGGVIGTIGASHLFGPLGARANVEYQPGRDDSVLADVNAMAEFDFGSVKPYVGAGVGVVNGPNYLKVTNAVHFDKDGNPVPPPAPGGRKPPGEIPTTGRIADARNSTEKINRVNDFYGNFIVGSDFRVARNAGLFLEGNGKYFFSGKTVAARTQSGAQGQGIDATIGEFDVKGDQIGTSTTYKDNKGGFGFGVRGGLKMFF